MFPNSLTYRIRLAVGIVLLCFGMVYLHAVLPVHASSTDILAKGTSGGCVWEYRKDKGDVILAIRPLTALPEKSGDPSSSRESEVILGTLGMWDQKPPWSVQDLKQYRDVTRRVVIEQPVKALTCYRMFSDFGQVNSLDLSLLDTEGVTNMQDMFSWCCGFDRLDLSTLNTAAVTTMNSMFRGCCALTSVKGCDRWDTSRVTDMTRLFANCQSLVAPAVTDWKTSAVTSMGHLFSNCGRFTSLDLSRWDTSSVEDMRCLFASCEGLTQIDLRAWITNQVTNMKGMFQDCSALVSIEGLGSWNTACVKTMNRMFYNCSALTALDMGNWSTASVTEMTNMFWQTSSLEDICLGKAFYVMYDADFDQAGVKVGTHWVYVDDGTKDDPKGKVFATSDGLRLFHNGRLARNSYRYVRQPVSEAVYGGCIWRYVPLTGEEERKYATYALHIRPLKGHDKGTLDNWENAKDALPPWRRYPCRTYYSRTTEVVIEKGETVDEPVEAVTCQGMFENFPYLQTVNISGLNMSSVKNVSNMFRRCRSLTSFIGIGTRNFENVQDMSGMFSFCHKLVALDLSGWNTSHVTNMSHMFRGCYALASIDPSRWDTALVEDTSFMFNYCRSLVKPGVERWNTASLSRANCMFAECASLSALDLSGWVTVELMSTIAMFQNCHALTSVGNLSSWNTMSMTDMNMMFYGCRALASLDLRTWETTAATNMKGMFWRTLSLKEIRLGHKFHLTRDSDFEKAGTNNGMYWAHVRRGTKEDPQGSVFATVADFLAFHNRKEDDGSSWYVRQEAASGICGSCVWEYLPASENDEDGEVTYELHIRPRPGNASGTLGQWKKEGSGIPPWRRLPRSTYYSSTTKVVIDKSVKASTCEGMFKNFHRLETADLSGLDMSSVRTTKSMFQGCNKLTTVKGIETWNTERVSDMCRMFAECQDLASLDMGAWNTSAVRQMRGMFRCCSALTSLDMSGWDTSSVTDMAGMFWETPFLKKVRVSRSFRIDDAASFDQVGKEVDTHWMQVNPDAGSAGENSRSQVFSSPYALVAFHNGKVKRAAGFEEYVRVTPAPLTVVFDKGADDVSDDMEPQVFICDEVKALTKNTYRKTGYDFDGWRAPDGTLYADEALFTNACRDGRYDTHLVLVAQWKVATRTLTFDRNIPTENDLPAASRDQISVAYGQNVSIPSEYHVTRADYAFSGWNTEADGSGKSYWPGDVVESLTEDMILYAQWVKKDKVIITYMVSKWAKNSKVSRTSEAVSADTGIAQGSQALPHTGYTFYLWTCNTDSSWRWEEPTLTPEQVEAVAKRTGSFVRTTFTAHFKECRHRKLFFDSNISHDEKSSIISTVRLRIGRENAFTIPVENCPTRANYFFLGWNTKPDGTGTLYKPGDKTEGLADTKVLYAQWEEKPKVHLQYVAKNSGERGTVSRASEMVLPDTGMPEGSRALPLPGYAFYRWTCDADPSWSYAGPTLTKEQIEKVAKKSGTFVTATFTARFKRKVCMVRFDHNTSGGDQVVSAVALDPISVRYGQSVLIPAVYRFTRENHVFLGWNTRPDGTGMSYELGETIEGVIDDMTLYAQWAEKDKVQIQYVVKGRVKRGSVSRTSEMLSPDTGIPEGATAVPFEGCTFQRWTCDALPSWSYTGQTLTREHIEEVVKKTGSLVPATFVAHFKGRIKR